MIPPEILAALHPLHQPEYQQRAEKAIAEQDPQIIAGVELMRKHGGYCELGDYASYEYLQWRKEKGLDR